MDFGEIAGGLMSGVGGVMERQGRAARESALKRLENREEQDLRNEGEDRRSANRAKEQTAEHGFNLAEGKARDDRADTRAATGHTNEMSQIGARGGQDRSTRKYEHDLDRDDYETINTDDGPVRVKKGSTEAAPITVKGKPVRAPKKDKDADESDRIKRVEAQFTTTDTNGNETINREGIAGHWRDRQREDLAGDYAPKPARPAGGGGDKPAAIALPSRMAQEPDGTTVRKGKQLYVKRGNQLIPK